MLAIRYPSKFKKDFKTLPQYSQIALGLRFMHSPNQ